MHATIRLGRILGIQIGLHYSWLIIAMLVAFSLAAQFRSASPEWGERTIWATAILTAVLFFVAIILHELSHAVVAKARGLPVRSITLFALGGVAEIDKDAGDAKTEFSYSHCWTIRKHGDRCYLPGAGLGPGLGHIRRGSTKVIHWINFKPSNRRPVS